MVDNKEPYLFQIIALLSFCLAFRLKVSNSQLRRQTWPQLKMSHKISVHTVLNIRQVLDECLINVICLRWAPQYRYRAALVFLESCGIISSAMWPVERAGRRAVPSASLRQGCSVSSTTKECWTSGWSSGWVTKMLIGWCCSLSQICMSGYVQYSSTVW